MTVVNKTVNVSAKQMQFLNSKALYKAFCGGIGSGKSHIGSLDMIRRAKPGRLYMVTAPTYPMLSDATFRTFTKVAQELGVVAPQDIKSSPPQSIKLRTNAEVIFRSTDNPEMLRGPNLSGVLMDEASLSKREAFDIIIGRLREGGEDGFLTAAFTPKGKSHWTYKIFGLGNDSDTELIHARSDENPFLSKNFVSNVKKRYTAQQIKQELGGIFLDEGGNHYHPGLWPRYLDAGDAYRVRDGDRWKHIRKADCSRIITLDWAMGKPKKDDKARIIDPDALTGDCTGFVVADLSYEHDGLLFYLYAVNERIPLGSNAPRLAELCRRWVPLLVSGDDDNLSEAMSLECRRFKEIPTIKPMGIKSKNKLTRSQAAIVRAERGMMYLPENSVEDWIETLSDQLSSFTGADGEADDLADCISIMGRLADEFEPMEDRTNDLDDLEVGSIGGFGNYDR